MTSAQALVIAGGVYHLAFAVFHLLFWRIFRWRAELRRVSSVNRAVVQVLNLCLTFVFVVFGYLSLVHSQELVSTALGRALLGFIAAFWGLRAIEQVVFFTRRHPVSWAFLVAFIGGTVLYGAPLLIGP